MSAKSIKWLFFTLVFILFFVLLQLTCEYHFYYIEQDQLFRFSTRYFNSKISIPGGFSLWISYLILQFFGIKYAGALLLSLLLTSITFFVILIMKRLGSKQTFLLLGLLPSVFLMFAQYNIYYRTQGTVAFLFMVMAFFVYLFFHSPIHRFIYGVITIALLFLVAGPVFSLYTICLLIGELWLSSANKQLTSLLFVVVAGMVAFAAVYYGKMSDYKFALLPDFYYNPLIKAPLYSLFAWLTLLLCVLTAMTSSLIKGPLTSGKKIALLCIQTILLVGVIYQTNKKLYDPQTNKYKQLNYYVYTSQWDKIIELGKKEKTTNYLHLNILNMALAEKGLLADQMFAFNQKGPYSLVVEGKVPVLLSDVYFTMGDIASAQRFAFEAYTSSEDLVNPRMLQRLVQTNLIFGAYPVAEKYIFMLEQSPMYKDWAINQRKFLYNDAAVEQDVLLGSKRRGLPEEASEYDTRGIIIDLEKIAVANPSDKSAIQYLGAIHLLNKDMENFSKLMDKYYGTEVLPSLPKSFQEAVTILRINSPEKYSNYQISEETKLKFADFNKVVAENQHNANVPGLMNSLYGNTYWYYYMFK